MIHLCFNCQPAAIATGSGCAKLAPSVKGPPIANPPTSAAIHTTSLIRIRSC